jgi:acetylornithine deacetylase/succinyl-diaminopimelate desuccinylase-like protein
MRPHAVLLISLVVIAPASGRAQTSGEVARLVEDPAVRAALDAVRAGEADTIEDQIRLCEIPAPPFEEADRARAYAEAFRSVGLRNVRVDAEGNVLGERPGRAARPHLVLSAHLDTVFPAGTDVSVTRQGRVLHGPGIGDDCRGLAVLLGVARALDAAQVETGGSITFVGTVGEEGLGDLRGAKALFADTLAGRIDRFVSVDGSGHAITHVAVGSHRYRVTFRGPGGHSYEDFGRANPVHALGRAMALIAELGVPSRPRTTFSVGRVGGGTSVNAIASDAWMEVDLRSVSPASLDALDAQFQRAVRDALARENQRWRQNGRLTVTIDRIGDRPAGRTEEGSPIVQIALAASRALGIPAALDEGSTDANVAMSLNVPAITVGSGGIGTGAHTLQEAFDTTDSWRGSQRLVLLAVALATDF